MRLFFAILSMAVAPAIFGGDEPSIKVGATIFADYSSQAEPAVKDADGNEIHPNAFNVTRAYLNVTGTLTPRLTFRITPDIARESGSGSSLSGSQQFRLKYAFAQLSLDEWTTKGSWIRFGMQQTPLLDHFDSIYRYRFQGTAFPEREGYLSSADTGISMRYVFKSDYGDVHAGVYNGDGYSKAEANDQKALQVRTTLRPLSRSAILKGLRTTLFYDSDHYVQDGARERFIAQATFEHPRANAGIDWMATSDRSSVAKREVEGRGWSVWATPRLGNGWELLLRHDENRPDRASDARRKRDIAGVAYWLPNLKKVTSAILVDYDSLSVTAKPRETKYGLKLLLTY